LSRTSLAAPALTIDRVIFAGCIVFALALVAACSLGGC